MNYQNILQFKGTWRKYQARVLENATKYLQDGRVHIVAAPGSGKTTLGIELIKRLSAPALVLAPSITIREQWVARITDAFLCEGLEPETYLSQDLKDPRVITIVTYQALHSAITRFKGSLEEDDFKEDVDYSDFDVISMIKDNAIGVLCLDECHHLRSEWWKALEEVKQACSGLKVIALTATPPYDSTPALWKRYMDMCGEIDEEITIPELVKEGSLCPHQDFVYFNYPTQEERQEVEKFEERSEVFFQKLMQDNAFANAIQSHKAIADLTVAEELLDNPPYFASILIFLKAKGIAFPEKLQRLLGAKQLPVMDKSRMETLLAGFLYDDFESFTCEETYRKQLTDELKSAGLIEKRKISFTVNAGIEKLLTNSKGKANSIRDIVAHEYTTLGKNLRLLVLTDYIHKEYENAVGNPQKDVNSLGVLPFFEMLRRENSDIRLGVLCGTLVVIPAEAKEALQKEVEGIGKITFSRIGSLSETDYVKVTAVGDAHFLTSAVTNIFTQGYMQVLVGTKSLLGEGWDSPCINSLILASFVGSFMLSNQMRGRAIRVFKEQPDKTSNIWHLVCLNPWKDKNDKEEISEDFSLLQRRMEHFLGLHYTENTIENGIDRLSYIKAPFTQERVTQINQQMLALANQRNTLKNRWQNALSLHKKMDIVEETEVKQKCVSKAVYTSTLTKVLIIGILAAIVLIACIACAVTKKPFTLILGILALILVVILLKKAPTLFMLGTPLKRLKACGMGIRRALAAKQLLEDLNCRVAVNAKSATVQEVYLTGKSSRDKQLFTQCIQEFFAELDNQRYILVKIGNHEGLDGFYCVPECFAKKKEDAEQFSAFLKPYIGDYELVYTRNERGRELLLEGRLKALANREERCRTRKSVKSALE